MAYQIARNTIISRRGYNTPPLSGFTDTIGDIGKNLLGLIGAQQHAAGQAEAYAAQAAQAQAQANANAANGGISTTAIVVGGAAAAVVLVLILKKR